MSITILHVSDLHYDPKESADQGIVLDAFFRDVSRLRQNRGIEPDVVVFSGDLVQAGEAAETFSQAHKHFISRLLEELRLPGERLFIVPGNHDVDRSAVRGAKFIEVGLKAALDKPEATNALIDQVLNGANQVALDRLRYYQDYIQANLTRAHALSNPFVTVDKLDLRGIRTAIACFNTAWRSTGEGGLVDNKNLLMGERVVDLALKQTADAELSLAVYHHPLEWLQDNDFISVEGRLHSSFDLLLFGHLHLARPVATTTPDGSAVLSQAGCLYSSGDYFNGYSIVVTDAKLGTVKLMLRSYQPRRREFDAAVDVAPDGQIEFPLKKANRNSAGGEIEDFLKAARRDVRIKGNRHLATLTDVDPEVCDIKQFFVCPPLSIDPERRRGMVEQEGFADKRSLEYETLLREEKNYVIYGARETGKTSLAHFLAVRVSEGICDRARIPVVLDFCQIKSRKATLWRNVRDYFSDLDGELLAKELFLNSLVVFLDNFQNESDEDERVFAALQEQAPGARWVCLAEESFAAVMRQARPQGFGVGYIEPLPRRTIRELSRRWSVQMGRDGQKAYEAVMTQLQRANLPRTGYIVALLLWAMHRSREHRQLNEAVLLENVLEHLLEKADFTRALRKAFDYRAKEITLQSIANFLKGRQNYADINQLLAHVIDFFRANGLVYSASDVLQKLIEAGVLDRTGDSVHFKYKCFQDYFWPNTLPKKPESAIRYLIITTSRLVVEK